MVTRKAVPAPLKTNAHSTPPYPTSPVLHSAKTAVSSNTGSVYSTDLGNSPAFDLIDVRQAQRRPRRDSESSRDTWNSEGTEQDQDTPAEGEADAGNTQLNRSGQQISSSNHTNGAELPPSLRIGAAAPAVSSQNHGYEEEAQSNPWEGEHAVKAPPNTNNPYLRQTSSAADNSQSAWQEVMPLPSPQNAPPPPPSNAPPPPPSNAPPPPPGSSPPRPPPSIPIIQSQTQTPSDRPSMPDSHASWTTVEKIQVPQQGQPPLPPVSNDEERPLSTWWHDDDVVQRQTGEVRTPQALPPKAPQESDYQPPIGPPPAVQSSSVNHEQSAAAPLRLASVQTSSQPSPSRASPSVPDTPGTKLQKQRNTTYQIRHVNWLDESRDGKLPSAGLRNSPIMTQNANGPCPLLALVNALVLTTPPDAETSLIETLRTREQISLGLLLDAVFDELVSNRREGSSEKLPDVSELYSFLLALHTGMNVNPRFVTPAATPRGSWDGVPPELNGVHPMHKAQHKTGAFEETMEMRLYSTFNIPLIHGWTAPTDTPAYEAFVRSAQTFEDAQNIQFMESDLEEKMRSEGLSAQETQTLEDIHVIKSFLNTWPTQLTDYGLETMSKSLRPGQVAILFRNDHFSTLYKEPNHGALMTLVTDAGYAGHDEIVWESLVDVNGAASEMFSGDFRLVSHGRDVRLNQGNSGGGEEGWTTVPSRSKRQSSKGANSPSPPPLPGPRPTHAHDDDVSIPLSPEQRKAAEQEDHDLALALQLQEEEEHQHRQAAERRQREQELSEQYISNESEGPRPPIPPRRSGQGRNSTATPSPTAPPPVNRPSDDPSDPDAPPSYEQAASDLPYRPAGSTAAPTQGNAIGAYDALRRQQSAYTTQQQQQSSTSDLPTFAQAGPSSPPYTLSSHPPNPRRATTSGGTPNRLRRESQIGAGWSPMTAQRTNQIGFGNPVQRSLIGQGGLSPGHHPRSAQARSTARLKEANAAAGYTKEANAKDAEDRCVVM